MQFPSSSSKTMESQLLFLLILFLGLASAVVLQNPDFESPPSNLPENSTTPFLLLSENSTIPGWTFQGTVQYVTASETIGLPDSGHALQLAQDGKINQTFSANGDEVNYILTFTIVPGVRNCSTSADVMVSAPDSKGVFSLDQHYGKETWQSYGHYLGFWGQEEPINLVIESQTTESDADCWPIVDTFLVKTIGNLVQGNDNLLLNGGFEYGPDFLSNSTEGILLNPAPSLVQSPLTQWSVIGRIKYIDSKHFFVPQGSAAIELVSGASGGIQTATTLTEGSSYELRFTLGDANDGCEGDFLVGVRTGSTAQNFTFHSIGTGSAFNYSLAFMAGSRATQISFLSYVTSQTKDGVHCGPVVDDVILRASSGLKSSEIKCGFLIFLWFLLAIL